MARFPHLVRLRPPRAARPLTDVEVREYHAVRLALVLAAGVLQAGCFVSRVQPIPGDSYAQLAWLRRTLAPLVRRSPTVALLVRLINLEGPRIAWDDPRILRRHLRRLAADVEPLAVAMRVARRRRA